jgi:hypothetical protein
LSRAATDVHLRPHPSAVGEEREKMRRPPHLARGLLVAASAAAVAIGVLPSGGRAADEPSCPSTAAYTLAAAALTGPTSTDVTLRLAAAPGCAAVEALKKVQIKTFAESGKLDDVVNLEETAVDAGVATATISRVEHGRRVEVDALVQTGTPQRTYVVRDAAVARLRPDLVVASIDAPVQTLTTRPVTVEADVREANGDTGATVQVTLSGELGPLADSMTVTVPAGGSIPVRFENVALTTAATTTLTVLVAGAAPREYDAANNDRSTVVEVTKSELAGSRLLVSLGGYGFQFNHHLYAPLTSPDPATLPDLESKVKALEPQLVRIFYSENWEGNSDGKHPEWPANLESFRKVVALANASGATIVIAYQGVSAAKLDPDLWMGRFADILQDLIVTRHLTNVRWVTIGNEPNGGAITLPKYEELYRSLDAQLVARGLRGAVGLMAGDLVQNTEGTPSGHRAWFDYMVAHMNDVVDAWSEHIYWNYNQPRRGEERIKDVAYLVHQELPEAARKPTFIMEYGVRGVTSCGTKPDLKFAYYPDANCTDLRRMPFGAFQKLAFAIETAQLGFDGASYWDLYWSTYDLTKANQSFWMIGPPEEGWALYPSYYAFQLLLQTTARGWQVVGVDPWTADDAAESILHQDTWLWDGPEQELVGYRGPNGELTIAGLDTNGRELVAPNGESSSYSIGGLPPNTELTLGLWNGTGDGMNSVAGAVNTGPAGVARFDVPLQAAFVLTTVPMS